MFRPLLSSTFLLLSSPLFAQDDRLEKNWPSLREAWQELGKIKPQDGLTDELLSVAARLHETYRTAGLLETGDAYLPEALKELFREQAGRLFLRGGDNTAMIEDVNDPEGVFRVFLRMQGDRHPHNRATPSTDLEALRKTFQRLKELQEQGRADEDNVQDVLSAARQSLKTMAVTSDDTPQWLRRRILRLSQALILGEDYPAPERATEAEAAEIRNLITDLGNDSIERREAASQSLQQAGEKAEPFVREALRSSDPEIVSRAQKFLAIGHHPWTSRKRAAASPVEELIEILPAPAHEPPDRMPEPEEEETPADR